MSTFHCYDMFWTWATIHIRVTAGIDTKYVSHPCDEGVGYMGQKSADPCISDCFGYCATAALYNPLSWLTQVAEDRYINNNPEHRTTSNYDCWYVLHPPFSICNLMHPVAPSVTKGDVGVRHCQMLENTTKYAWCIPYIIMMMFEAGSFTCLRLVSHG